jgi:UPF0716 protein FxsA
VEIYVFLQVGGLIGTWPTIAIVVLTAILGTWLLRLQGLATLRRFQHSLAQNVLPVGEVFDGLCLLVAGALLLTPGFVTDTIGFLLFVPPLRRWIGTSIAAHLQRTGRLHMSATMGGTQQEQRDRRDGDGVVIDGDYEEVDPDARKLR